MAKVLVVRHGTTDFNVEGRYQGSENNPLNEKGIQDAQQTRSKLSEFLLPKSLIVHSPYIRCVQTAKIIKGNNKIKMTMDDRLRERSVGVYEGLTKTEVQEKYPQLWQQNATRRFDLCPPGGEMISEVQQRVFPAVEELGKYKQYDNFILVTHGFVSRMINKYFNPKISEEDFFAFALANGSFAEYELNK